MYCFLYHDFVKQNSSARKASKIVTKLHKKKLNIQKNKQKSVMDIRAQRGQLNLLTSLQCYCSPKLHGVRNLGTFDMGLV